MATSLTRFVSAAFIPLLAVLTVPDRAAAQMTPERFLGRYDANGNGSVSKEEFTGARRPFEYFDTNGDGIATREEIEAALGDNRNGGGTPPQAVTGQMLEGQIPLGQIDAETRCGIGRNPRCDIKLAIGRGLFSTGLEPSFPDGLECRGIDEGWAISYTAKRDKEQYHGGIDMPAPYGTPMLAAADGTVVAKSNDPRSYRGIEVIVRHSPQDTGLPVWTYTQYAHFNEMPTVEVGERVKMGQNLGPTGNSGFQRSNNPKKRRRPAIHFAVWFSEKAEFAADGNDIIPLDGWWMDPNALYRQSPPFDSASLKALPDDRKRVDIPVILEAGGTIPPVTKLIWPYACWK